LEQTIAAGRVTFQVLCRLSLGEAHIRAARLEEAHALAAGALTIAREHQERGNEAYALHLLGDIAARPSRKRAGPSLLPAGPHAGRRVGDAPTPGPLPPRLGHTVCCNRPVGASPRGASRCHGAVPRHGDDLLATPG